MDTSTETPHAEESSKKSPFDELSREDLVKKCKGLLVIAQKAKQAKTELQGEVENYKLLLEKSENEKTKSIDAVKTLEEVVASLTDQKLNYITEIDSKKLTIKSLHAQCTNLQDELSRLRNENVITTTKLSDFDSELVSLKRQNIRLVEENEQLITQLTDMEAKIKEFNKIGLEQREQLKLLEEKVYSDNTDEVKAEEFNNKVEELEQQLKLQITESEKIKSDLENKLKEATISCEQEKESKEKANHKLRSYREKILKCSACINQLKNTRYILTKTVREYSESIPRWQGEIVKASKMLDKQIQDICEENSVLKGKLKELEQKIHEFVTPQDNEAKKKDADILALQQNLEKLNTLNNELKTELAEFQSKYDNLKGVQLPMLTRENEHMQENLKRFEDEMNKLQKSNTELKAVVQNLESRNDEMNESMINDTQLNTQTNCIETLTLQIRALESEKASLVKEKFNAKDSVFEVENQNKLLNEQINNLRFEHQNLIVEHAALKEAKEVLEKRLVNDKQTEVSACKTEIKALQEQYDLLKKEYENIVDLNGILKDEVETLKLSLEQPRDDVDNVSELTASLQTDLVKLETKLAAYKQENSSLLVEVKESRIRIKELEALSSDIEDSKSKLLSYKTENSELLNEMKEINQVLKERGEAISKLQKAIAEMERLVETLEKDRDVVNSEKESLLKKLESIESDLRDAEQKTSHSKEANNCVVAERDEALKLVTEKDQTIALLKDELEKLKQMQASSAELPNEDMSTSTISRVEDQARMKDLDESFEEKYSKLRIFALKLKKKLNETTSQLNTVEQDKLKLEKLLNERSTPASDKQDQGDGHKMNSANANLEKAMSDLQTLKNELELLKVEYTKTNEQLTKEVEAHKATKDTLEKVRRDVKKKSVLSLEMEDYERSMKELTTKLEESKKKIVQMESTIDTQEGTITAMKTQIKLLEEQIKTEETQSRLTREDLQRAIDETKEKDLVIQNKNEVITKLEKEIEIERRKCEDSNIEMTALLGDKEKVIVTFSEEKIELNNKLKRAEFNCAEMKEKLKITSIELEDLKTEYASYKVRAQAVLRQNQTVDHSQEELLKEEAAALRAQIDSLTSKLNVVQDQCTELQSVAEAERRRANEAAAEASRAAQRTARLQADLARQANQLESERSQHKLQASTLTQCYKSQIADLETRLLKETEELQKKLSLAQEQLNTRSIDNGNKIVTHSQYMVPLIPKEDSDGELEINVSMLPREDGEGSESAPSPPLSKSFLAGGGTGGRSPVPLERLLEEGVPEDDLMDTSSLALTMEQEIGELRKKVQAQQERVKHVTVLLSESERECARYAQMNELLKAEVRRARGSLERTEHAHNAEYMKNVTMKFVTLPPGDERSRLVPVLQKILTLTPDETQKLNAVAKGMDPNPTKGWGSYLPWPGGK